MSACDGGPAFPQISELGDIAATSNGMSLRDWFAGQVAAASMTNANGLNLLSEEELSGSLRYVGEISYRLADAMLAAREVGA